MNLPHETVDVDCMHHGQCSKVFFLCVRQELWPKGGPHSLGFPKKDALTGRN